LPVNCLTCMELKNGIGIISAPSILGLKPGGVQELGKSLLKAGFADKLNAILPETEVPDLNRYYSRVKDTTGCLNSALIREYSENLMKAVATEVSQKKFTVVLGGDCSVLIGIMPALKSLGSYGLIYMDGHADFYSPKQSVTGEVADMGLAIVTGRGPSVLTNINRLKPYVKEENVIHIGQRDEEETIRYGSEDIRSSNISCFDFKSIVNLGIHTITDAVTQYAGRLNVDGFWIHFDTDVLADEINPAVDYRLPGGLLFEEAEYLVRSLALTRKVSGISISIFNPVMDHTGKIAHDITNCLARALSPIASGSVTF